MQNHVAVNQKSKPSLGPERIHLLETYCKCLRRAERRIKIAGQIVNGARPSLANFQWQRPLIEHAAQCMRERGFSGHASALVMLEIKRSRFAIELEGLEYRA